jgi:FAD/FMN-containing dehydrogenase
MLPTRPGRNSINELREQLHGSLITPEDPEYDDIRRVWNGMHDRKPALIARCAGAPDVSAAIRFARSAGLPLTVRGGGHNVAGTAVADGALLIDLSLLRGVVVHPGQRVAEAQGGCLLRDLDAATTVHGLACPAGVISHTGLGGLTLGGGYGWRSRAWGLTCDQIISAEVVLADGSILEASEEHDTDLWWALRGGGGNFGVVTRFTLRLHEVGPILLRTGIYHADRATRALRVFQKYTATQPTDVHVLGSLRYCPTADWIPASLRGQPVLDLSVACSAEDPGSVAQGAAIFAELRPDARRERTISYFELQALGDRAAPHGRRYYTKSGYLAEISEGAADGLLEAARRNPSSLSSIDIEYLRGAICNVGDDRSAFPQRDAPFLYTAWASWTEPQDDAVNVAWSRNTIDSLAKWQHKGGYFNYMLAEDSAETVAKLYGKAKYERLMQVKRRYDPDNLFRTYRSIPAGG